MVDGEFGGVVGRYHWESSPWWPEPPRPPAGAPNVLFVVIDDVGFAQLGCFGSDLDTPTFDRLAANGLRYRNFHTTALCSPTRSCVLTGRNHHSNGMGRITDLATGFPGYNAMIPKSNGFLSEMLVPLGYAAWAVGKWHLTPASECHLGASRARWPLGRGFERFYGYFGGETQQYSPALVHDNHLTEPPHLPQDGYHLTEDLADTAIRYVHDLRHTDPTKPFFCYFCTGACHSPHQAPREWIDRYRGRFDDGWDAWRERTLARQIDMGLLPAHTQLSPRPDYVPAWNDLSADEKRVYARYMEAFAGFLSHADHNVGRVLDALADTGDLENTIVFLCSDNGASSEGGPLGSVNDLRLWNGAPRTVEEALEKLDELGGPRMHNNYPWGWTVAGNTPFRRWKREVHEGGVADPLIVSWPSGIRARGEIRSQYVHAIDLLPTVLDVIGVEAPSVINGVEQRPVEGATFAHTFDDPQAASLRDTQYYEMFACRALYHRGWKAVVYQPMMDREPGIDTIEWELYDVEADPSECNDLAREHPERLREMIDLWWREAERYQVLPLDNRPFSEFVFSRPEAPDRSRYVYWPDGGMVPEELAPNVRNRTHTVTAEVDVPETGAEGVLVSQGSVLGGWALYVRGDTFTYFHNLAGWKRFRVDATVQLSPGRHTLAFRYSKTAEFQGVGELFVDGAPAGEAAIPRFTPVRFSITDIGLTCGHGDNLPVSDDYVGPFPWTGTLHRVVIEVDGEPHVDAEGAAEVAVATQ